VCNYRFRAKAVIVAYPECVFVAVGIQHTMHMRHVSSLASTAVRCISILFHKRHDFRKKNFLNITFVFTSIFSKTLSETFFILRRAERVVIKNFYWPSCKVPIILSDCNET
jgi:precorrin-6x reductase